MGRREISRPFQRRRKSQLESAQIESAKVPARVAV